MLLHRFSVPHRVSAALLLLATAACSGTALSSAGTVTGQGRPTLAEPAGDSLNELTVPAERVRVAGDGATVGTLAVIPSPDDEDVSRSLHLWNLRTGHPLWRLDGTEYDVSEYDFSPDGRFVATVGFDGARPALWNARTGEHLRDLADREFWWVVYGPDGTRVLLTGGAPTILVDPRTGEVADTVFTEAVAADFSPDGRVLAAPERNVLILELQGESPYVGEVGPAGDEFRLHGPTANHVQFHPGGGRVLTSGYMLRPTVYDLRTGDTIATYPVPAPTSDDIVGVTGIYSPGGSHVLTRIESGTEAWLLSADAPEGTGPEVVFASDAVMEGASFSPDGRLLVTTHDDASTRVWNARTGKEIYRRYLLGVEDWLVLTPDGRYDGSPGTLHRIQDIQTQSAAPGATPVHVPGLVAKVIG